MTASLWPPITLMYAWVWRVASVLGENGPNNAAEVRQQLGGLLGAMVRHGVLLGTLAGAAAHFVRGRHAVEGVLRRVNICTRLNGVDK